MQERVGGHPATVRGVIFPPSHCPGRGGKAGRSKAPSQETGLEKYSDASSGLRSGETPFLQGFSPSTPEKVLSASRSGLMEKFSRFCAVFCCFFALSSNLRAEQAEPEASGGAVTAGSSAQPLSLPEVVVTANRLDVPVSEVAASMSVLTAKQLEQKQAGTVLEALQGLPGLDIVRAGGAGEVCSIYTRGSRTADTLVMMDGIPLNDPVSPARSYDYLDQLSVDGVGQIEVLRGPQSTLYGSNAMGGVVNLLTREGEGPLGASLLFEGGAYHTFRETASLGVGSEKGNLSLSLTHFDTAGYSTADKEMGNIQNNPDQS